MRGIGATRIEGGNAGDYTTPTAALRHGRRGATYDPVAEAAAKMAQAQIQRQFFYQHLMRYGQ